MAEQRKAEMVIAFEHSNLREVPNLEYINELTFKLREKFYNNHKFNR